MTHRDAVLRLHWSPDSANLPVRLALEMFGLSFENVRVNRAISAHKLAEYLAKNPQGLIPVLEDGDLCIFETGAILWHLAERCGRLGPDGPEWSDQTARAAALTWMFYLSNTVHADLRIAFYPHRYVDGETAIRDLRMGVEKRMRAHFDLIEAHVYSRETTDAVTVPDIYLGAMVRWAQLYPRDSPLIDSLEPWPEIRAMCQRIETQPAAMRAFPAESIPEDRSITAPRPPDLPQSEVTGAA